MVRVIHAPAYGGSPSCLGNTWAFHWTMKVLLTDAFGIISVLNSCQGNACIEERSGVASLIFFFPFPFSFLSPYISFRDSLSQNQNRGLLICYDVKFDPIFSNNLFVITPILLTGYFISKLSLKIQGILHTHTRVFLLKFQQSFLYIFQQQVINSINFHNLQIKFLSSYKTSIFIYYHQHKNNFFFSLHISSNISVIILF